MGENKINYNGTLLLCHICNNKTRTKAYTNTIMINYPLFCPKCKRETIVNVEKMNVSVIESPKE